MKFKKLVLMGLLSCTVTASRGIAVLAAETEVETASGQEDTAAEKTADGTINDRQGEGGNTVQEGLSGEESTDGEAAVLALSTLNTKDFLEEVENVTDLLENSIASSLCATIENERAKLPSYTKEELMYLSCIIYCEAGSQEKKGKIAVANVIMNRVESDIFDHVTTIKEAIYDCDRWGRQFSPVYVKSNGKWTTKGSNYEKVLSMYKSGNYPKEWQKKQMQDCIEAAKEALTGKQVIDSSFLYFNMGISSGKARCQKNGKPYTVIGGHIFY
ncbi:MAG: cell wall hydrolase [Lachnospiraceae bacterium]|nr:cell wall hydrolase [Lachnospiraceae bacterium]